GPWNVEGNWGDNSPVTFFQATGPGSLGTVSHDYEPEGVYTVTETVTDTIDRESDTKTFKVGIVRPLKTPEQAAEYKAASDAEAGLANGYVAQAQGFLNSPGDFAVAAEAATLSATLA